MQGIGVPLVTPFTQTGAVDFDKLSRLIGWLEARDVDFLVPCGSTGEAELLTQDERQAVIETVCAESSVPVLAGTGNPGLEETIVATTAAVDAGADGALVVTPYYYNHTQSSLANYYRELADESDLPIYLYSVPKFTDVRLHPETVAELASHNNIVGMKDSSGSLEAFLRTGNRTADADFDLLVGSGSLLSQALEAGASGAILAMNNLVPEHTVDIYSAAQAEPAVARERHRQLVELNAAVTSEYGIPGLKWAMRQRGAPAGTVRRPHQPVGAAAQQRVSSLLDDVLANQM